MIWRLAEWWVSTIPTTMYRIYILPPISLFIYLNPVIYSIDISIYLSRSNMFELADRLVGIYKTYNCTKSVCINPGAVGQVLQPNNKVVI